MKKNILFAASLAVMVSCFCIGCKNVEENNYTIITISNKTGTNMSPAFNGTLPLDQAHSKDIKIVNYEGELTDDSVRVSMPVTNTGKTLSQIPYTNFRIIDYFCNSISSESIKTNNSNTVAFIKNGSQVIFDAKKQLIYFENFNLFFGKDRTTNSYMDISYEKKAISCDLSKSYCRAGRPVQIDLASYGLQMFIKNKEVYLPLQTISDLISIVYASALQYNGSYLVLRDSDNLDQVKPYLYDENSGVDTRTEEFKQFTYNELCLCLDMTYGLKENHGITSFNELLTATGDKARFFSIYPLDTYIAMYKLCYSYLADVHSWTVSPSYFYGNNAIPSDIYKDFPVHPNYIYNDNIARKYYPNLREETMGEDYASLHRSDNNIFDYTEIENENSNITAIITFDHFVGKFDELYSLSELVQNNTLSLEDVNSLPSLAVYAHQRIKNNPRINKVVLDISCNEGGQVDSNTYLISWLLGECRFNLKNTLTGAVGTTTYYADVNLDEEFNEEDSLMSMINAGRDLKLYCVYSNSSFSCGNLLPCILKESGKVAMIGKTSGGGACVVGYVTAADGSSMTISSVYQLCSTVNGSYNSIEYGAVPDFSISDYSNVFNRNKLLEIINSIK